MPKLHMLGETEGFCRSLVPGALVAERDGVAGFLALEGEEIVALYCRDRGTGVGRALLERAKVGRERLALRAFEANGRARRFYAREGFAEVGGTDGENEEGLPDVLMEWRR
ncbi:GNAT family N-acetyltransferase [Hasllibacter halocynthiae]|nr:GNAT family N-acetyltransferase [Hasllibacter halocynthiae]